MVKKQVLMADDDEFDHIDEEFTKECNVMFVYETYVLEGETDAKFFLGNIWNLFQ